MMVHAMDLMDCRHQTSLLICVILVLVFPILVATIADKHEYRDTYERKTEGDREFSKNTKQSKHHEANENSVSQAKHPEDHPRQISDENGSSLSRFLENVLKAQDDLKWIDQIVHNSDQQKKQEKSSSTGSNKYPELPNFNIPLSGKSKKARDKRSFLWNTNKRKYQGLNPLEPPQRVYLDSDMSFEKNLDSDNVDTFPNGMNGKEADDNKSGKSLNEKEMQTDQLPKEWANTKDICSLNDWLNSNNSFKTQPSKREHRPDSGIIVRNQRDETKKEESSPLESLKETILELKKSLNEDEKKEHGAKLKEKGDEKEGNTRAKNKHKKHEKDIDSSLLDDSEPEESDSKEREQDADDLNENNVNPKTWRRKRTEVNNEDGSSRKLFHRAGFGESYPEEEALKELHDRKRRSKGTPSNEKYDSNEPCDKNNVRADEKDLAKVSNSTNYISDQGSKLTNNLEDATVPKSRNGDAAGNYEHGNSVDNKLPKNDEKGDSAGIFGSRENRFSGKTSALNSDEGVKGEGARIRQEEVLEPEGEHQLANTTQKTEETTEEYEKPSEELSQEKEDAKDVGNINIIVKSESKNLIKFSNTAPNDESKFNGEQPYVLNRLDVKRKLFLENEEKPGKSMASMFNVKIEKEQVDTPAKDAKQERTESEEQIQGGPLNFGRNKQDELYESKQDLMNDMSHRNVDEKGIQNSVEINKGSTESSNKEGTQNWYKNHDETNVNNQDIIEKNQPANKEEKLNDNKIKETSAEDSNDKKSSGDANPGEPADKSSHHEEKNKRKYTQIVIVPDGLDDRKLSDMYGQRRILQYMEYSNDDVEDADASFSDKEEENQRQATAEKSSVSSGRKRAALRDKTKAKVNVLIKQKLEKRKKKKKYRDMTRKRRNPVSVIEYYDYDSDNEQREHEAGEQERIKTNYDKNPVESNAGLETENLGVKSTCLPPATKKNEHQAEMLKQQKMKSKHLKQEFIVHGVEAEPKNTTEKTKAQESLSPDEKGFSLRRKQEQPGRLDQGEGNVNNINRGRLNQPIAEKEDKFSGDDDSKDSETYIFTSNKDLSPEMIDNFLEDIQTMDEKKEKMSNNFDPLYEELIKIYDWKQDEAQNKPRIKGDHRMFYGANDKLDPTNKMSESYTGQIELPETQASSPNLMPLLLHHGSSIGAKTCSTDDPEHRTPDNVSRRNYYALKSTDDLFKGGSEQSNNNNFTEGEKLRGAATIGPRVEWSKQKVNGRNNEPSLEKDAGSWSLTDRGQYIDTDSRSPYENRKYLKVRLAKKPVQNILDPEKQMIVSSRDLHESFVDPLDQIDDLDEDLRLRLGRSLKTIDQERANKIVQAEPEVAKVEDGGKGKSTLISEQNLLNVSTIQDSTTRTTSKFDDSKLGLLRYPILDLQELFNAAGNRVKRQIRLPYDAFYDDTNRPRADSKRLNYYGDSRNEDRRISKSNDEEMDEGKYAKVVRRESSKKSKKHKKRKKQFSRKGQRKKGHGKSSKLNLRKRRHPKKHSNDSKGKNHEHRQKKHKKRTSKTAYHHRNVKKSKVDDKIRQESSVGGRNTRREKVANERVTNTDSDAQRKISSLLTIDNVEDESQMDSALHGELAGKIMEQIYEQVQKNEDLKTSLGPGLYKKHKTRDTISADKTYRQTQSDDEISHTTELLNKIMHLLDRLIFDEVQRKTCVSLSPDLAGFLDWMLDVDTKRNSVEQLPSLPMVHPMDVPNNFPKDKFLFQSSPGGEMEDEFNQLGGKLQLVQQLINEYKALTDKDKSKVKSVHDYLSNQLDALLIYVSTKEKEQSLFPTGAAKKRNEVMFQYEGGPSNASNDKRSMRPDGVKSSHKGHRTIRSLGKGFKPRKKPKNHKHKKKNHKRHKGGSAIDHPSHKAKRHKAKSSRQKREYLDKEFQDFFDSEYEEPLIYSSMDFEDVQSKKREAEAIESPKDENGEQHSTLIGGMAMNQENEINSKVSGLNEVQKREVPKAINSLSTSSEANNMKLKNNIGTDTSTSLANFQSSESNMFNEKHRTDALWESEEPITGKDQLEDEIILLNKQQSWKKQNEEQLEEVAFGEDMREGLKEKELFEKLTEIDKKKDSTENTRTKKETSSYSLQDCTDNERNRSYKLSTDDKLRLLEEKINVYSDK